MKKLFLMILSISIFMLLINSVSAAGGGTYSYYMDVQYYTVPDTVTHYISLINTNNYTATVTMEASDNIKDMIEFSQNPIVLAAGEDIFVPFNVTVTEYGTWEGTIKTEFYVPELNMPFGYLTLNTQIRQGTCEDGETKECIIDGCAGTQTCQDNDYGECIKNDPECGVNETCVEAWTCSVWSDCQPNNLETRTCTDMNECGTELNKPAETRACIYDNMNCNCTEIMQRLEALENDVSALESLINSIQEMINSILSRLTALEEGTPVQIQCSSDSDCNADSYVGDNYCSNGNVYQDYRNNYCVNPGQETSHCSYTETSELIEECSNTCENGACVSEEIVVYRTNVENGNYRFDARGSWIAVDCNQDGLLEAYGGLGVSRTNKVNDPIGQTPEGYEYECFGDEVRIKLPTRNILYLESITPDETPVLSLEPTEPYASNNQEVYE